MILLGEISSRSASLRWISMRTLRSSRTNRIDWLSSSSTSFFIFASSGVALSFSPLWSKQKENMKRKQKRERQHEMIYKDEKNKEKKKESVTFLYWPHPFSSNLLQLLTTISNKFASLFLHHTYQTETQKVVPRGVLYLSKDGWVVPHGIQSNTK